MDLRRPDFRPSHFPWLLAGKNPDTNSMVFGPIQKGFGVDTFGLQV